jgi:uncharacterized protein (TIGR00730 family)
MATEAIAIVTTITGTAAVLLPALKNSTISRNPGQGAKPVLVHSGRASNTTAHRRRTHFPCKAGSSSAGWHRLVEHGSQPAARGRGPVASVIGMLHQNMNVCVFCSANDLADKYMAPARQLASLLAEHGHSLVWGGSDTGVMKVMADGVQAGGGRIYGVSVELLKQFVRPDADEMVIARDLGERKAKLLSRSDVIVVLPGGLGTLDELTEILELRKHGAHDKAVIVMNSDGFYDGLITQLERMSNEGFIREVISEYVTYADTPEEAIALINSQ